jgi:hypothetical protein
MKGKNAYPREKKTFPPTLVGGKTGGIKRGVSNNRNFTWPANTICLARCFSTFHISLNPYWVISVFGGPLGVNKGLVSTEM